jgi:hypothetical protein
MPTLPTINGEKMTRRALDALHKLRDKDILVAHWAFSGDQKTPDLLRRAKLAETVYGTVVDRRSGWPAEMLRITDAGRSLVA